MKKYINEMYNVILPLEYLLNLNSYQFSQFITIEKDEDPFEKIQKEYFKGFYISMVENDVAINKLDEYLDHLEFFNSPYDFFLIDLVALSEALDLEIYEFLIDFIACIDTDNNKFNMLLEMLTVDRVIVQVERALRNVGRHPFYAPSKDRLISHLDHMDCEEWFY